MTLTAEQQGKLIRLLNEEIHAEDWIEEVHNNLVRTYTTQYEGILLTLEQSWSTAWLRLNGQALRGEDLLPETQTAITLLYKHLDESLAVDCVTYLVGDPDADDI